MAVVGLPWHLTYAPFLSYVDDPEHTLPVMTCHLSAPGHPEDSWSLGVQAVERPPC